MNSFPVLNKASKTIPKMVRPAVTPATNGSHSTLSEDPDRNSCLVLMRQVFDRLWNQYLTRVPAANLYQQVVLSKGGQVVNDHIAFRTFHCHEVKESPKGVLQSGVDALLRIFSRFGYIPKGNYKFPDKYLNAIHLENQWDEMAPKIFLSQLEVDELPSRERNFIVDAVLDQDDERSQRHVDFLNGSEAMELSNATNKNVDVNDIDHDITDKYVQFFSRHWLPPIKSQLLQVNELSQYAAWTLLHGYSVNHFTAFINYQNVPEFENSIDKTIHYLHTRCGMEMKQGPVVGPPILRQTASVSSKEMVAVRVERQVIENEGSLRDKGSNPTECVKENFQLELENEFMEWTYAYYEFAQRGLVDHDGGEEEHNETNTLYQGFLEDNTPDLFNNTKYMN
ncbi:hypothetical protein C9374_012729 [Naegleria lovaniensis]|uniref:2-oxoadipate dioxygenase/decarboxylase n=1 Tax=Naegleria lovaniensis TaxID=51637 RepID=A0AA88H3M9_NAELO|nr:uncharacterized protein C9374_012729 [Naegleria lovaniensis]KAG2392477.1 hypothetical protein C9374_012729 [Naegleria lovaniensis]